MTTSMQAKLHEYNEEKTEAQNFGKNGTKLLNTGKN